MFVINEIIQVILNYPVITMNTGQKVQHIINQYMYLEKAE